TTSAWSKPANRFRLVPSGPGSRGFKSSADLPPLPSLDKDPIMSTSVNRTALLLAAGMLATTLGTAGTAGSASAASPCSGSTCSFNVPPGTYEVSVTLGSKTAPANTGLDVEAHRTVLAPVAT